MSLILEALRKSEAERQVGRLPGLMSPPPRLAPARRWPWVALAAGLPLALVAAWWLGHVGADRVVRAPGAARVVAASPPPPASAPAATVATTPAPAPAAEPAMPAGRDAVAAAARRDGTPPKPVAAPPTAAPPTIAPPPAMPAAAAATAESSAPAAAGAQSTLAAPPPKARALSAPANAEPEPAFPRLAQMRPEQRQALPALKLSVHVFNPDPAARFAIVDGRRVREGDRLDGGVQVREIRRDGVLLDIGGQPWLLAR